MKLVIKHNKKKAIKKDNFFYLLAGFCSRNRKQFVGKVKGKRDRHGEKDKGRGSHLYLSEGERER